MLRWGVFLVLLALVWIAKRRETPPVDRADQAEPDTAARSTPPPVEPRWAPPPREPAVADVEHGADAADTPIPGDSPEPPPAVSSGRAKRERNRSGAPRDTLVIEGLSLRDADGQTIERGSIDLGPTVERIAAGRRLRYPNDGATFQNRERRLPGRPSGYYREWVVPTPGIPGPGPQRLVTGEDGDVWYTPDHYRSFRRVPTKAPPR